MSDQTAIVPTVVDEPMDFTVVASNPLEMAGAQRSLILWCARKIQAIKAEEADLAGSFDIAIKNGWESDAIGRALDKAIARTSFYRKLKAALEGGYYIVPPFPIDIFAIRTDRKKPSAKTSTSSWDRHSQTPRLLPPGEGRYVARDPTTYQRTIPAADAGTKTDVIQYFGNEFRDVEFPFKLAKPEVMEATAAAMALKVFDQIGCLPAYRAPDPIVCGQILKPDRWRTPLTFFITWWLDTRTL